MFAEAFDMDGKGFAPFSEFMWCFSAVFSHCCLKVLSGSLPQVSDKEAATADCHKTVCLMVGIKLAVSLPSLCGQIHKGDDVVCQG